MDTEIISDNLCPLPWLHLSVHSDQSLRMCCNAGNGRMVKDENGDFIFLSKVKSYFDIFNLPFYKNARMSMMKGKLPSYCSPCKNIDEAGGTSIRKYFLHQYNEIFSELLKRTDYDGHVSDPPDGPKFLDLSLGNNCNLRCRMCNPDFSNLLTPIFEKLKLTTEYSKENIQRAQDGLQFDKSIKKNLVKWVSSIDKILLQGGEPFLTKGVWTLLKEIIDLGYSENINLKITSNLTILTTEQINILLKFKAVIIHVSLEGTYITNNYIRQGCDTDIIHNNIKRIRKLGKVFPITFDIHSVFQVYNMKDIVPFIKDIDSRYGKIPTFGFLRHPDYLSPNILPEEWKKEIRNEIENHLNSIEGKGNSLLKNKHIETVRGYLDLMEKVPKNRDALWLKCLSYTKNLDSCYSTNISDLFPQMGIECYGK